MADELLNADLSKIELRVLAHYADGPILRPLTYTGGTVTGRFSLSKPAFWDIELAREPR